MHSPDPLVPRRGELAVVLPGGGAWAAYQVGVLRAISRHFPDLRFPIITGISAGAINAVFLAAHRYSFAHAADELAGKWSHLTTDRIFRVENSELVRNVLRSGLRLVSGGRHFSRRLEGLLNTAPLLDLCRETCPADDRGEIAGLLDNFREGRLKAVALTTLSYTTGKTVTWVQGRDIEVWEKPSRRSVNARLTHHHILASAALPIVFPAVRLGNEWHGDGGVRLSAPLSPAVHLGASRILTISTRYAKSFDEADVPMIQGYPPPAQILGQLADAVFLDVIDQDALRLERFNSLLEKLAPEDREGLRPIELAVIRPSQDLGKLAAEYEPELPHMFRFLTRALGTRETTSSEFLSLLMFVPDYLRRLIAIGEADAEERIGEIAPLLTDQIAEEQTTA